MKLAKSLILFTLLLSMFVVFGCKGSGGGPQPDTSNSSKEITSFSFLMADNPALSNNISSIITGNTIGLAVPSNTDVTSLVASYTTTGETVQVSSVIQTSGLLVNDFTDPVIYTVTAKDGTTMQYTVTVIIIPSNSKELTSFSFPMANNPGLTNNYNCIMTGNNISVTFPYDTNITTLRATFVTTGETVTVGSTTQVSGSTQNNFSSQITYRVTAEDGTTNDYYVNVSVASGSAKDITLYSVMGISGVISGNNINLTVPFGTDVTSLAASFNTTGQSVEVGSTAQVSGITLNDFTNPVIYTVTAFDSSTSIYTVTVTVALNSSKELTNYYAGGQHGVYVDSQNITLTFAYGMDFTALAASFTSTGDSVRIGSTTQVSGITPNDFSSTVTYTVHAADNSTKNFYINPIIDDGNAKDILSYYLQGVQGVISGNSITVDLPYWADRTDQVATYTTSGTTVSVGSTEQTSGFTHNDFTSPVVYTVEALNGTTKDYTVTVPLRSYNDILTYSINGVSGVISGTNINLTLPYGTNLSSLTAAFTHQGTSIKIGSTEQTSGVTQNNFSGPVVYRVTAENGSIQDYTVFVSLDAGDSKDILSYSINGISGVISGTNINLTLPYGTDLTSLTAAFTHQGTSIKIGSTEQTSGVTQNNFTSPVVYSVTAENGSMQNYTVFVSLDTGNLKDILSYSLSGVSGVISSNTITVALPYWADRTDQVAAYTTSGKTVSVGLTTQISGVTHNDFTNPVVYTVEALNGSTKNYTVTAPLRSHKDIISYSINGVPGVIVGTNINLTLPYGTNLTSLTAVFAHQGTSIKIGSTEQTSGITQNNFSGPVVYRITAEDGTTKDYTVYISTIPGDSNDIIYYSINGVPGNIIGNNIGVTLPNGTNVNNLTAVFTITGLRAEVNSVIQTSGSTSNDFTNPVTYSVFDFNSNTKDYVVTVNVVPDTSKYITSFVLGGTSGTIVGSTISVIVPYGTDLSDIAPTITHTGESIDPLSGELQDFTSPVNYTVTAEDSSSFQYVVYASVASGDMKDITSFNLNGYQGRIVGNDIGVIVPFGTDLSSLTASYVTTGESVWVEATEQTNGATSNNFISPVTYRVEAVNGTTKEYVVRVAEAPDNSADITSFSIMGINGVITGNDINVTLPYGTNPSSLIATFNSPARSVKVNTVIQNSGSSSNNFSTPLTYSVLAHDGYTSKSYTVNVEVALNDAKDITAFSINGVNAVISGTDIDLTLPYGTDPSSLIAVFSTSGESTNVGGTTQVSGSTYNDFTNPVVYQVTAENGSTKDYTINVELALNDAKDIVSFSINGINGVISGTDINLTLPLYKSYLLNLVAVFSITGESIDINGTIQLSGSTYNDFRNPIIYRVYAENGTTKDYNVTVNLPVNEWIWISGNNIVNQSGVYGTKDITDPANKPGSRSSSVSWIDSSGNLWLFGGAGYDSVSVSWVMLNDLWKFDGTNWTWVSGDNTSYDNAICGTKNVTDPTNKPGSRVSSVSWIDSSDNLWLFGGYGYDCWSGGGVDPLNDLWKFDGSNWTWVSGDGVDNQIGVYGTKGIANSANKPGGRDSSATWIDSSDNLWLFGGFGVASSTVRARFNDLWKFDGSNWTWVSGDKTAEQNGVYGTKGTAAPSNKPGSRTNSASWIDSSGNLWL
ncbi:beta strand repeat-containing protein, partial [Spirochaetota bacterium]